jgi:hypothetical protein
MPVHDRRRGQAGAGYVYGLRRRLGHERLLPFTGYSIRVDAAEFDLAELDRFVGLALAGLPDAAARRVRTDLEDHSMDPYFKTRNRRCMTPGDSITLVLSSSIFMPRWSNKRIPPPSRIGTRSICISSRSPARRHCWAVVAP